MDTETGWNTTTRHMAGEAIKGAFSWAEDEGRIVANPIRKMKLPRGDGRDFIVDNETFETIIDGSSDRKYHRRHVTAFKSYLIAMHLTGCRPGEPLKVMIESTDSETWTIKKHKTKRAKKNKKPRVHGRRRFGCRAGWNINQHDRAALWTFGPATKVLGSISQENR